MSIPHRLSEKHLKQGDAVQRVTINDIRLDSEPYPMALGRDVSQGGVYHIDLTRGPGETIVIPKQGEVWWIYRRTSRWALLAIESVGTARDGIGQLASSPIVVRKNGADDTGPGRRLNFVEGSNVTLDVDENGGDVDVTINSSASGGSDHDLFSSTHDDVDETDTPANDEVLTFDSTSGKWRAEPASGHGSHVGTHGGLSGVTANQHHNQLHNVQDSAHHNVSGTFSNNDLLRYNSGTGNWEPYNGAHGHAHSATTGQTANDHHNQSHGNTDHTTGVNPTASAVGDAVAEGTNAAVARADHRHGREGFGSISGLANTNTNGVGTTLPRSDHQHKRDIRVAKAGSDVGTRNRINFIEGANVTITVTDDSGSDEVDVTIASTGGSGEAFPVGSVFIAVVATNPATLLGYGTWSAFGAGRVLVGLDSGDTDFDVVEETGGSKSHQHPSAGGHQHEAHGSASNTTAGGGASRLTGNNLPDGTRHASDGDHQHGSRSNLQPYIVVYMWKRTA